MENTRILIIILLYSLIADTNCYICPEENGNHKNCFDCPDSCLNCTTATKCTECKPGLYGDTCEKNCTVTNCKKCNIGSESCNYCYEGFRRTANGTCLPCPPNCIQCSETFCGECKVGFKGSLCKERCGNCIHKTCDQYNGKCLGGCSERYGGELCLSCASGRYGLQCEYNCSKRCHGDKCDQADGICLDGCTDGLAGDYCNTTDDNVINGQTQTVIVISSFGVVIVAGIVVISLISIAIRRRKNIQEDSAVDECAFQLAGHKSLYEHIKS